MFFEHAVALANSRSASRQGLSAGGMPMNSLAFVPRSEEPTTRSPESPSSMVAVRSVSAVKTRSRTSVSPCGRRRRMALWFGVLSHEPVHQIRSCCSSISR